MHRLLAIGFTPVGHWRLWEGNNIRYVLENHQQENNVLYCFVSNGEVKYIGKTTMPLFVRMNQYRRPGLSQSTNIRVRNLIIQTLENGSPVDILLLRDNGLLRFGDFRINLAAGLEGSLIAGLNPAWNTQGVDRAFREMIDNDLGTLPAPEANLQHQIIQVDLGPTYYTQGFFNIRQTYSQLFAGNNTPIEIQLGDNPLNTIEGYLNRTANRDGSPRVMGGAAMTQWIQRHFQIGAVLEVEVFSPTSIKILQP